MKVFTCSVLLLTVALTACGNGNDPTINLPEPTPSINKEIWFAEVRDECIPDPAVTAIVADRGRTMVLNRVGQIGPTVSEAVCVLYELGAPYSVPARIDRTRAVDGTQVAEWDGIRASWTYHPNNGLNLIIEMVEVPEQG